MEMPPYHLPTIKGILIKAWSRVWLFLKKITTIVAAVAVVLFVLLQFPGLDDARMEHFEAEKQQAIDAFLKSLAGTGFEDRITADDIMPLVIFAGDYKSAKSTAGSQEAADKVKQRFEKRNPDFFPVVQPGGDKNAKKVSRAYKKLDRTRRTLLLEMRQERLNLSFLGRLGHALEPATKYAGFNWRVNVALLSALAAKESSVATLGALYQKEDSDDQTLEDRMAREESGFTPLAALALMLFMVLYPPCIATAIAVKIQSGALKWMLFSITYPMVLGIAVATLVYSGGSALGLDGLQAMFVFYGLALLITIIMGFNQNRGGLRPPKLRRNDRCFARFFFSLPRP